MKNNVIPRNWRSVKYESLIKTNADIPGDIITAYRDDTGVWALNHRTQKHSKMFTSMLRLPDVCRVIEILK